MPKQSENKDNTTHFGFKTVETETKQDMVNDVFTGVAWRYDVMNDAMSFGMHHAWKDQLIKTLSPTSSMHLLDVAGGTGDIARRFLEAGGNHVTLCDINEAMLDQGKQRMTDANLFDQVDYVLGNAEKLPLENNHYDAYTIAFGIRNVTHIDKAIKEAYRVLKPGGRFLCLEFSKPQGNNLNKLYDFYSFKMIPAMGKRIAGDAEPYDYLVESIRKFPDQETFKTMIEEAGFQHVKYTNLTGGIVAIHSGWKV